MKQSDVASLVRDASYEPDPLGGTALVIKTTVAPGHYDGDDGAVAVQLAATECVGDQPTAIAIIDRDGNDMGR